MGQNGLSAYVDQVRMALDSNVTTPRRFDDLVTLLRIGSSAIGVGAK